jgi:predicted P-loop ATPase
MAEDDEPERDPERLSKDAPERKPEKRKVVSFAEERRKRRGRELPPWAEKLQRGDKGAIIPNLDNAMVALEEAPQLAFLFAYDLMAHGVVVEGRPPVVEGQDGLEDDGPFPRPLCDSDVIQVQRWLQRQGMPRIARPVIHDAIARRAADRAFHPIREWLVTLEWDREVRLNTFLVDYFGCENTPYVRTIGFMVMIALVARVMEPGCQCDYMLVLEGDQGVMKSSALKILGGEWFSDALPDIHHSREASQHLRGKWVVEFSELAAIVKADPERLKSFLTRRKEIYLPRFAHNEVHEPRQFVPFGTTNKQDQGYLADETGTRRIWPVKVGRIDLDALADDRPQLFAEAIDRYRDGAAWWPTPELEALLIKPEQDARYETDPWEDDVLEYCHNKTPERDGGTRVQVSEIARMALKAENTFRVGTRDQRRISAILIRNGWRLARENSRRFYWKKLP